MSPESIRTLTGKRLLIALAGLAACSWLLWYSARTAYGRTLAIVATTTHLPAVAARAVELSPFDAETHVRRGELLQDSQTFDDAVSELATSARLRPRDYYLWVELGMARDQSGDQDGALRAMRQATSLAPSYANARWQLGNLLLRMGQYEEAFAELRRASSSDPSLLPNVIDLAWGVFQKDVSATEAAVAPHSDFEHMALANFLARHGAVHPALDQFLLAKTRDQIEVQSLLNLLLDARAFNEAYAVWAASHQFSAGEKETPGSIRNSGFEDQLLLGDQGFNWQIGPHLTNIVMSLDQSAFQNGSKSLRIEFRGDSEPETPFLTQVILVAPQTRYRLTFFARAREIVSAASPVIIIEDASSKAPVILGQSQPITSEFSDWRQLSVEFTTGPTTTAVKLRAQRQPCTDRPCPAFGTTWLDSFSVQPQG